jgi:hypothetical protein
MTIIRIVKEIKLLSEKEGKQVIVKVDIIYFKWFMKIK